MTQVTQWYKSLVKVGSFQIPVKPGGTVLTAPRNFIVPPIVGNYWAVNYAPGLVQPVVDCDFVCLDDASFGPTLAFFNLFMPPGRSNDVAHDTPVISGGIQFWNGRQGFTLTGAKADSYMVRCSAGEPLTLRARFCGSGLTALGGAPTPILWSNAPVMAFPQVSFGGGLAGLPWSFNISYSNNHNPDLSLNGTIFPSNCNAGELTVGFSIDIQAADEATIEALTSASVTVGGALSTVPAYPGNIVRTFSLPNIRTQSDLSVPITNPRAMRSHTMLCLGGDGTTSAPLAVS